MDELKSLTPAVTERSKAAVLSPAATLRAWLEMTCSAVPGANAAIIVIASGDQKEFHLSAAWPGMPAGLSLVRFSEKCLGGRKPIAETEAGETIAGIPLADHERLIGALIIRASAALSEQQLRSAVAVAGAYLNQIILGNIAELADTGHESMTLQTALLKQLCRPDDFPRAAMETVNWLATRFACTRVGLGMARKKGLRLEALSHAAWFDRKTQEVTAIENAMDEALDQRRSVVLPVPPEGTAAISIAHRDAARGRCVCSVVLAGGDGLGTGVLYLERPTDLPFTSAEVHTLEQTARMIGPVLESRELAHRWIGGRTRDLWQAFVDRLRDPRRPALRAGIALGILALGAVTLVDASWRVGAEAAIEGEQQRVIPAPFEGYIAQASVKAGLVVRKDQPLAELDSRQTRLDLQRWIAEEAQYRSRYHDALAKHDQPLAAISLAQMQQALAQRALAEDKLARSVLRAPYDAFVVSGDLSQQIGGPVEQGKVLFELAPLDAYRVIVKVDESDIRAVRVGQGGHLVLSGLTGEKLAFRVKNISVPEAKDGRNVFRVEAQLDKADKALRPGMQGVAKIEVGERSLLWIWTHKAWHWLQLQAWKWLP
jgi:hypothetical protein